jgi:hypothetical protein
MLTLTTFSWKMTITTAIPPEIPHRLPPPFCIWYLLGQNLDYNRLAMAQGSGFM